MANRKRVIYQSEALFVGATGNASPKQLNRVQSANYSFDITRKDVNQYGQLAYIDRIILEQPTVSIDFTYYANSGENEANLGFALGANKSALADILSGSRDINNYYILVSPEGTDANIDKVIATGQGKVIGIGNAGLTSYSIEASVGDLPTVSVNAEGLNMKFYSASTGFSPHITPADGTSNNTQLFSIPMPSTGEGFSALRPGDISFTVTGVGISVSDLKVQKFNISADIGRDPIQKLGSRYAFTREITFPVTVKASVEAILGDIADGTNNLLALSDIVCSDTASYDLAFTLNKPATSCGGAAVQSVKYTLKGAKLDSQQISSAIGDNKSVSLTFSTQIGGPTDTTRGLFIEGPA
jgi:hypothetical protein